MFGREPVLWMALIQAGIALGVGFGLSWTGEQVSLVTAFAAALLAFIARSQVTPNTKLPVLLLCLLLGGGFSISACATRADGTKLSPEGTFALRGTAVVNAINGAAPALEALTLPDSCGTRACLSAQEGLEVATKVREGLEHAKQLPGILTTVDKATTAADQKQGMAKATAVIQQVIQSLNAGLILPSLPEARLKVVLVLQSAQLALIAIGGF